MAEHLALYGSLMRSQGGLARLGVGNALAYGGPCRIRGQLFDFGAYPGLRLGNGTVAGELYLVRDVAVFRRLDEFEGCDPEDPEGSLYLRRRVRLLWPAREAWVYVYNRVVTGRRRVPAGSWKAHVASDRKPF